ncbi:MAG: hypothetical protein ACP5XB_02585 [Isosphaeraceae bacterium]
MGKHFVPTCDRRPNLDFLESRYLLSGGTGVFQVSTAPAIMMGFGLQLNIHTIDFGPPGIMTPVSYGAGSFEAPFHGGSVVQFRTLQLPDAMPPWSELAPARPAFNTVMMLQQPFGETGLQMGGQESAMTGSAPLEAFSIPEGSPPADITQSLPAPFFAQGSSSGFSLADFQRYRPEDPSWTHQPPDKSTGDLPGSNAATNLDQGQTASSPAPAAVAVTTQPAQSAGAVNQSVQAQANVIGFAVPVPSAHVSRVFGTDLPHGESTTHVGRPEESASGQPAEPAQGPLPAVSTVAQVATDSRAALTVDETTQVATLPPAVVTSGTPGAGEELPLPQSAGLITSAAPFDRAALERAVDQFFDQLEALGTGQLAEQGTARVLPLSLALLGAVTVVEMARRRLRSRGTGWKSAARQDALGSEELLGFPELPGSWSTRLT